MNLTPADLLEVRKIFVAAQMIGSGAFTEELKKLEKASADLDAKYGAVLKLDELKKQEVTLQLQAQKIAKESTELSEKALEAMKSAEAAQKKVDETVAQVQQDRHVLKEAQDQLAIDRRAFEDEKKKNLASLAKREAEVKITEERMNAGQKKLSEDRRLLDERLAKLKQI